MTTTTVTVDVGGCEATAELLYATLSSGSLRTVPSFQLTATVDDFEQAAAKLGRIAGASFAAYFAREGASKA